jgi:hypothetical protein
MDAGIAEYHQGLSIKPKDTEARYNLGMIGVKAHKGIGMKDFGYGEPLSRKTLQELPGHPAPLTATPNHMQPAFAYLEPKTREAGEIAAYTMIVEVTLHHTLQPSPDFRQRLMHAHPQGSLHLLQLGEKSLPDILRSTEFHCDLIRYLILQYCLTEIENCPFVQGVRMAALARRHS